MSTAEVKRRSDELNITGTNDFIESHLDSYFPPSEEVIEESELESVNEELEVREDASLDFDNDTLTNVEEYSLSGEHDTDKDGIPNIYDSDDDEDGLSTSLEERYDLDPYDPSDAESDLDNDGLSNIFEHENGLSLNREDTDSDGIIDGAEYDYWREEGFSQDVSINYCKEPDVDGDNITDGKEINGYEAKVITGWTDDGEPISELRTVDNRDPLVAYRTESGEWSDTDSDGIPDVVESWFSNASIATNDSYRQNFVDRWPDLYENYSWVKDYFETINETENISKAEQWLTDQFNTMVREKTPPMVTKFTAEFYWDGGDLKLRTHVKIRDVGGIENIKLKNLENTETHTPDLPGTPTSYEFEHIFDTTVFVATGDGVELNLTAKDVVGNEAYAKEKVEGAIGSVVDALEDLWSAIAGVLSDVAEAVAEAVSVVVDWIINMLKELINRLFSPIKSAMQEWANKIARALNESLDISNSSTQSNIILQQLESNGGDTNSNSVFKVIFGGDMFQIITALAYGFYAGYYALMAVAKGITLGMDTLVGVVAGIVIGGMFSLGALGMTQIFEKGAEKILKWIDSSLTEDKFLEEGVGLALFDLFVSAISYVSSRGFGGNTDAKGLIYSFFGLVITLISGIVTDPLINTAVAVLGAITALRGAYLVGLRISDIFDKSFTPWSLIEEALAIGILLYSSVAAGAAVSNLMEG